MHYGWIMSTSLKLQPETTINPWLVNNKNILHIDPRLSVAAIPKINLTVRHKKDSRRISPQAVRHNGTGVAKLNYTLKNLRFAA